MPELSEVTPRVRVGTPLVRHNLTVFPLFAEDSFASASYISIGAAIRSGSAKITEASEGGSVPILALENLTDIPVRDVTVADSQIGAIFASTGPPPALSSSTEV